MSGYENARWVEINGERCSIRVEIYGVLSFVPVDPRNTDYQNIMRLVSEGYLVIAPADA